MAWACLVDQLRGPLTVELLAIKDALLWCLNVGYVRKSFPQIAKELVTWLVAIHKSLELIVYS